MAYRGEDLDLRTPQGWSSSGRDAGAGDQPNWWTRSTIYKGGRSDPIWIDDNVMACCNHAYDLALAHRAPEVRLEHLINALTLNDAVAHVLEARGLSVASLRRESGAFIANEVPHAANGQAAPKRSEALEDTLRLAADRAYPRRAPVGVDDLLHVLFDMKRDLPGLQLLHRHATSWSGRNGADNRPDLRLEPLPHLSRPVMQDPRPASVQASWPRYASPAAHDYFGQPAREPLPPAREHQPSRDYQPAVRDYQPAVREPARIVREPAASSGSIDGIQNNRIDSLERAVRDLGIDLADDRKTLQSLVGDLQRTASAQADDAGRFRGNLSDRLASLEETLVRTRSDSSLPAAFIDRMGAIERNLELRLAEAARSPAVPQIMLEHLTSIERNLDARLADIGRSTAAMGDRLQALEMAQRQPVEATLAPLVSQRLESITAFGSKIDALERTFQLLLDRITGVERKLAHAAEHKPDIDLEPLDKRLGTLETTLVSAVQQGADLSPVTDLLSGIEGRVAGLERSLENRTAETGRTVSFIGERLRSFEEAIGTQRTQGGERLTQIERSLTAYAESSVAASSAHERELTEVHEALLKLNANQQTLAGSLDQWRLDNTGDLSVINNRLKTIEEINQRRVPMVEELSSQVSTIHASLAKREVRKSRFRHWLFGTDEWYSASYDTRRWRARQIDEGAPQPARMADASVPPVQRPTPPAPPAPPPSLIRR